MPAKKPAVKKPKKKLVTRALNWRAFRKESALVRKKLRQLERISGKLKSLHKDLRNAGAWERKTFGHVPTDPGVIEGIEESIRNLRGRQAIIAPEGKAELQRQLAALRKKYGYKA